MWLNLASHCTFQHVTWKAGKGPAWGQGQLSVCSVSFAINQCCICVFNNHSDPGACFVCNTCPSDRQSTSSRASDEGECSSRPSGEGSAACVETTAYALLALLEAEDTTSTLCLAQWLVRIRSGSGGFYSSQVHVFRFCGRYIRFHM